MRVAVRH